MGAPSFSQLVSGAFLVLTLTPLLFKLTFSGLLAALGCDHPGLGGYPDIILQC